MAPVPWDDDGCYDDSDEGPEAQMFRTLDREQERAKWRTEHLLRAIELDENPIEQGRRAAERMWNEVQARLRQFNVGRRWVSTRRPYG